MDKKNESLDKLIQKAMQNVSQETPSVNFTDNILSQIAEVDTSEVTTYKPLISKQVWAAIFVVVVGLIGYLALTTNTDIGLLSKIDYSFITDNKVTDALSDFSIPTTFKYALVFLSLMVIIQVFWFKNYFDKRLQM